MTLENVSFLKIEEIIEIHQGQIQRYGGIDGLRDERLLSSATEMPKAQFGGQFLHDSVPVMAAAYLFHICQGHAFLDGNKRTALVAAVVFLDVNGFELTALPVDVEAVVLELASGHSSKAKVTTFFEEHCRPISRKGKGRRF